MLFVFPNLNVYSSLGSYTMNSQGLEANKLSGKSQKENPPNYPVAVLVGLAVGYGTHVAEKYGVYNAVDNQFEALNNFGDPVIADYQVKQNYNMVCNGFCQSPPKRNKPNYNTRDFSKFDN